MLAIEFFERDGKLLANEMAPRVHNSGHWTIEGALTSQFENHLRAVVGLPLGSTLAIGVRAMLNLIGEVPDPAEVLLSAMRICISTASRRAPGENSAMSRFVLRLPSSSLRGCRSSPVFFIARNTASTQHCRSVFRFALEGGGKLQYSHGPNFTSR